MKRLLLSLTYLLCYFLMGLLLIACQPNGVRTNQLPNVQLSPSTTATVPPAAPITPTLYLPVIANPSVVIGQTQHRADGNRVVAGQGNLPALTPVDIPLAGVPAWVVAVAMPEAPVWAVALADGQVHAFTVVDGVAARAVITPTLWPAGMPPLLTLQDGAPQLRLPSSATAPLTHPVLLRQPPGMAYLDPAGNLVIAQAETTVLSVNALPDARLLVDDTDRLLLLTQPTGTRYAHNVLGDPLEATAIVLIETKPTPQVVQTITIAEPHVIEGIAPIWADVDGDGRREIIVTQSAFGKGAQIVLYAEDGSVLGRGPAIGQSYRWRHQLAVAPFAVDGGLELVAVLTPHIGGVVEFYQWQAGALTIVAQQGGYTSHVLGSRNLDMAVAGDFDGDGQPELLLPDQVRRQLGAVHRTAEGAVVAYTVPTGGQVVTNVAAVTLAAGGIAVGVGRSDGVLRIWQP